MEVCELKTTTPPHSIVDSFKTLQGFLVKKIGDTFQFFHSFVKEVTTFVFGKDYPLLIIKSADIGFLRKRVTLESCNDNSEEFTINLSDRYIDALGKRLFNEIFGERLLDVVLNPCLKNKDVINVFIQELINNPNSLNKLLEKQNFKLIMKISIKRQIISLFLKFLLLVFKREYPLLMILLYFVMQVYLYIV